MGTVKRVGVIGLGHVGAHVAYNLLMLGLADELYLCSRNQEKLISQIHDLDDSMCFMPYNTNIVNCENNYEKLAVCDIIVNCAGDVAGSANNRDGELYNSTNTVKDFVKRIVDAGFNGIFLSIANPCDVVCTTMWKLTGYDPKKIIGSGCGLDSARLRMEISKETGISPKSIDAYIIGEHGFAQVAAWNSATIAGERIDDLAKKYPDKFGFDKAKVEERARKGGYVTFAGKKCTEYAVSSCAARVCGAILHNEHAVLSVSTLMTGQYGEEGVFSSLPCTIGANGVEHVFTPELSIKEQEGFHNSCDHTRESLEKLGL